MFIIRQLKSNYVVQKSIEVTGLKKQFGEFVAVNNISFTVNQGEIFAFLGPNGAGKTTTIKMLTTVLSPTSGAATLEGHDVLRAKNEVRKNIGIVFQDSSIDDELTVLENMELHGVLYGMAKKKRRERTEELLKMVDLWDKKDQFVKTFSGGMKRRLEIARGLLHKPKILFLDEPTAGLDPQTRNKMWEYLENLNKSQGITVFFTTHYMEEAQKAAQKVAIIDHGKILIQGTPKELQKKTKTKSLEEAFLKLTGKTIRAEESSALDSLRVQSKLWGRRR